MHKDNRILLRSLLSSKLNSYICIIKGNGVLPYPTAFQKADDA